MTRARYQRGIKVWAGLLLGLLAAFVGTPAAGIPGASAAPSAVYFPATGHHVSDQFLTAWRARGGLEIIGYPLTEPFERDGLLVQYFERARFELHPEQAGSVWEVQGMLLGSWAADGRSDPAFAPWPAGDDPAGDERHRFFPETRHFLSNGFMDYWDANGGLPVFGYPISEEFSENGYAVQYFERARLEWHPEYAGTPYAVLLGLLGVDRAAADGVDTSTVPRLDGVPDYDPGLFDQQRALRLPVLMYHRFGDPAERYQIPYWSFAQQLDWLQASGYTTVTLGQVYDYMDGHGSLPANPVVLTFDDGFTSQWEAAQMLDARGMRGVFFITTGQPHLADWQIRALADAGHEIGAHTIHHPALPTLSDAQLWEELAGPKAELEAASGKPVDFLAYPYGEYDGRVIATAEAAGYRGAVAAWGGHDWTLDKRWFEPRIEIPGYLSLGEFAAYVQ